MTRRHAHQWLRSCAFPGWVCAVCPARRYVPTKAKPRPVASAEAS